MKFHDRQDLAVPLAEELLRFAGRHMEPAVYDCLVPVPLHKVRLRERGYNQSELLARRIEGVFPNADVSCCLERIRPTRVQSTLKGEGERRRNVAGAFAVPRDVALSGGRVLLIDDVVTSGGTVAECARALRRAGAKAVDVFAVATPAEVYD